MFVHKRIVDEELVVSGWDDSQEEKTFSFTSYLLSKSMYKILHSIAMQTDSFGYLNVQKLFALARIAVTPTELEEATELCEKLNTSFPELQDGPLKALHTWLYDRPARLRELQVAASVSRLFLRTKPIFPAFKPYIPDSRKFDESMRIARLMYTDLIVAREFEVAKWLFVQVSYITVYSQRRVRTYGTLGHNAVDISAEAESEGDLEPNEVYEWEHTSACERLFGDILDYTTCILKDHVAQPVSYATAYSYKRRRRDNAIAAHTDHDLFAKLFVPWAKERLAHEPIWQKLADSPEGPRFWSALLWVLLRRGIDEGTMYGKNSERSRLALYPSNWTEQDDEILRGMNAPLQGPDCMY